MLNNEIVAELKRILTKTLSSLEDGETVDKSVLDRMDLLVEAVEESLLSANFLNLLKSTSTNRTTVSAAEFENRLKRLDSLLETQLFVEGVNLRTGGNLDLIPFFEPDSDERARMLKLCAQIRDVVLKSRALDNGYRNRLLKRVSAMEIEIHKEKGMFDTILGGMSEFGESVGKFGKDVKPAVEILQEIEKMARGSSKEYKQLPQPDETPLLPAPDSDDEEG